jgi:hypothetical protein
MTDTEYILIAIIVLCIHISTMSYLIVRSIDKLRKAIERKK